MNTPRLCLVPRTHPAAAVPVEQRIGELAGEIAIADSRCLLEMLVKAVRAGYDLGHADTTRSLQIKAREALYGPDIPDDPRRTGGPGELEGDAPIPTDEDALYPEDDHHPDSLEHQE